MVVLTLLNLIARSGRAIGEVMGASANRDAQDRPAEAVSGLGPPRLNELFRSWQRIALFVKQRDCFLNALAQQNRPKCAKVLKACGRGSGFIAIREERAPHEFAQEVPSIPQSIELRQVLVKCRQDAEDRHGREPLAVEDVLLFEERDRKRDPGRDLLPIAKQAAEIEAQIAGLRRRSVLPKRGDLKDQVARLDVLSEGRNAFD